MEGISFNVRCINDLLINNFKLTPPAAKEMQDSIISGAVALGIDDPEFWDLARSMESDLKEAQR